MSNNNSRKHTRQPSQDLKSQSQTSIIPDLVPINIDAFVNKNDCNTTNSLSCIEIWGNHDKTLKAYSMHEEGIKHIINHYKHIIHNGNLQIKFTDFSTDETCYLDLDGEFKTKVLSLLKELL